MVFSVKNKGASVGRSFFLEKIHFKPEGFPFPSGLGVFFL
jgi:hypothetical protein